MQKNKKSFSNMIPSDILPWGKRGTAAATFAGNLVIDKISHQYPNITAVKNASLTIEPGEIICLLGASGCGKTTLLRIIAGIERQTSGTVLLDGKKISTDTYSIPPEKRNIGLMFQDYALFPHLSILQNVIFGLKNLNKNEAQREAENSLKRVGMLHYKNEYPTQLSGGEQQRVALARALAPRPAILLMDEPFSGLDQRLRENIRNETLILLKETRASCLLVTHDPVEAMWMADKIAFMKEGHIIQIGDPWQLYNQPKTNDVAQFFSHFNRFNTIIKNNHADTPVGLFRNDKFAEGTKVSVLVRPQGILPYRQEKGRNGRVISSRFLGESNLLTVLFENTETPVLARPPGALEIAAGDVLKFQIAPEHVFIFQR